MKTLLVATWVAIAAPAAMSGTITSVTRGETPDEKGYYTIVIEGTGFGEGPEVVLFDDFENQTLGQPVDLEKGRIGKWRKPSSTSLIPKVVSFADGKAMSIRDMTQGGAKGMAQMEAVFPQKVSSIFISYSVVVPEGRFFAGSATDETFPDASSWKFTWITDGSDGIASRTTFNLCAPTHGGRGSFLLAGNSVNHGWISLAKSWSWHTQNYISFGMIADPEKPKETPGQIIFHLTGKKDAALLVNKTDKPIYPESNTTSFDRVKFPGWFGNGDQKNFEAYYDDIYVATGQNAMKRVELSDQRDLKASVANRTLPVFEWTATRIRVGLHKSQWNDQSPGYLRVYDEKNVATTQPLTK